MACKGRGDFVEALLSLTERMLEVFVRVSCSQVPRVAGVELQAMTLIEGCDSWL